MRYVLLHTIFGLLVISSFAAIGIFMIYENNVFEMKCSQKGGFPMRAGGNSLCIKKDAIIEVAP